LKGAYALFVKVNFKHSSRTDLNIDIEKAYSVELIKSALSPFDTLKKEIKM
jgi:hypothetical protein